MRDLGYSQVERWERTFTETIEADFVVGYILSATSTDQIPAVRRTEFAREVRAAITGVEPSGHVVETVPVRAVLGRTGSGPPN